MDANFFKNKIVCIWDDVVTTGTSFCDYTAKLEQVGARVTNGIFLGKTSYKIRTAMKRMNKNKIHAKAASAAFTGHRFYNFSQKG